MKIDRTFIAGLTEGGKDGQGDKDAPVVRTILELARNLNLDVVAEGIETPEQEVALIRLACPHGQGYHYFKPMGASEVESLLSLMDQRSKTTG